MTDDERLLKALGIKPEPIPVSPGGQQQCPHQQKKELVVELWRAEQEGCLTLAEYDWWRTMEFVKSLEQSKADLDNTVQNWIERARENDKAMRAWRRCSVALGGVMCAIEGLRLWGWIN